MMKKTTSDHRWAYRRGPYWFTPDPEDFLLFFLSIPIIWAILYFCQ